LAVKTPIPLLVTGPGGLWMLARDGGHSGSAWRVAPLGLVVPILTVGCWFSRVNIGIRHWFVFYSFLAMGGAYALAYAWRSWGVAGKAGAALLVGWQVSALVTAYPDYFPYFNEAVSRPEKVLVDSDLDWSQDLRRLERRLAELKVPRVSLAYQGTADLAR